MNYRDDPRWTSIDGRPSSRRRLFRILAAFGFLIAGGAAGVTWSEWRAAYRGAPVVSSVSKETPPPAQQPADASKSDEPVEVSLTPDAVERAGIKTAAVGTEPVLQSLTVPGTV